MVRSAPVARNRNPGKMKIEVIPEPAVNGPPPRGGMLEDTRHRRSDGDHPPGARDQGSGLRRNLESFRMHPMVAHSLGLHRAKRPHSDMQGDKGMADSRENLRREMR